MRDFPARTPLHDPAAFEDCLQRLGRLTPESRPLWGEMSVGQMLAHCAEVQEVLNGKPLEGTPWFLELSGPILKRIILARRPYPRNAATHPQYLVTDGREFDLEMRRLREALQGYRDRAPADRGIDHAIFGAMSADETGWAAYKHLDHHLAQFGV